MEGATPQKGMKSAQFGAQLSSPLGAPSGGVKRGSLPPLPPLSCGTNSAGQEGDARGTAPLAFVVEDAENTRPMRVFRQILNHDGEGFTL